jgi:SNF2 family DNA or RNA helicase
MSKYKFRTKPYAHQKEGVRFALRQFRDGLGAALLFEPRTGKTKCTVDIIGAAHLKHGVRKVLVIAPNRVMGVWVAEIAAHTPLTVQTIVWDAKARRKPIPPMQSAYDVQILITNYEAFGTPGTRLASGRRSQANGRFKQRQKIKRWLGDDTALIVCDESHRLKNPSGKAANMIVSMRPMFAHHMILTGTPITKAKRAADIYMQWRLINPARFEDWGYTYDAFRTHTGVWTTHDGIDLWRRANEKGMRDLTRGIHADGMVVHRDECFDLPDRMPDRIISVPLGRDTAKHYDEMAADFVTRIKSGELAEASIPIVVNLRLSQITSGHVGIAEPHPTNPDKMISRPVRIGTEKLAALKTLLVDEVLDRDEKVVVCARFKPDLNAIEKLCAALGIRSWSIRGGMTRQATDEALKAFKRYDDGPAVMVVQPAAGGVGIDMSTASHMIWFSLISSYVDWTQMKDRIALSPRGNQHTYLLAPGTIDHVLYDGLHTDKDVTTAILRKPEMLLRSTKRR